jgi:hypothetical protein
MIIDAFVGFYVYINEMHGSRSKKKNVNTKCGQNVDILNVKVCGTFSKHWTFKVNCHKHMSTMEKRQFYIHNLCEYSIK